MRFSNLLSGLVFLLLIACHPQEETATNSTPAFVPVGLKIANDSLQLIANKGLVYFHDQPFSGIGFTLDSLGKKVVSIRYVNGKKHGAYRKWFSNGSISFEAKYVEGKLHGTIQSWWGNGNLRNKAQFKAGVAHGEQWQWYPSGAKFKRLNLSEGREEGMQQAWRENGKIYNNYEAKNGRIFGLKRSNLCFQLEDEVIQVRVD